MIVYFLLKKYKLIDRNIRCQI